MAYEIVLPKMGESVAEATITKWLKAVGDTINEDEPIVEIATDKVDSEIPSPYKGILQKIHVKNGEVVKVGKVIATIGEGELSENIKPFIEKENKNSIIESTQPVLYDVLPDKLQTSIIRVSTFPKRSLKGNFYSPLVRKMATQEQIGIEEMDKINGSGKDGRVNKSDIIQFIQNRNSRSKRVSISELPDIESFKLKQESVVFQTEEFALSQGDKVIPMDRMRKLIAEHMVKSKQTSPHVTAFVEVDVTGIVKWRENIKDKFEKREGEKITFTPIFIEAVVKAIKDFPLINSSVDGNTIIKKNYINIGMAAALPSGNLIVPVIRNADRLNLIGLTKIVNDLSRRARANKLLPDEIQGGTFTLTNVGTFGNIMGTPIINQPQVAILATGAIRKKPAVIETLQGDTIGIRHMMFLSLSFDHRIVDGSLGGSFVRKVADYLENFDGKTEL